MSDYNPGWAGLKVWHMITGTLAAFGLWGGFLWLALKIGGAF